MNLMFIDNIIYYGLLVFPLFCLSRGAQNVAVVLLLLCFVVKTIFEKKRQILDDNLTKGIGLFFIAAAISVIFAFEQRSIETWFDYLYRFSVFFIAAFSIKSRKQVQWILIALAISIVLCDLSAIWQWLNNMRRPLAFFGNPMILASHLTIIMPILFVQVLYNREHRFIFVPALLLSSFTLIINLTRGAWIALFVAAIVGCIFIKQYRKQIFVYMTVALILLMFLFSLNPKLTDRFYSMFDMQKQSNSERILLWNSTIQMVIDHPVTGVGLGNFHTQYPAYVPPQAIRPTLHHAHNILLHIFAETGILGGTAFLYLFYLLFKTYLQRIASVDRWQGSMAIAGFLMTTALFLQGMTEYVFYTSVTTILFWFVSGVVYASLQIKEA